MSVAERLRQEGEQKGRQEGIRIGEEKGIRIGAEKGKLEGEKEKALAIAKAMLLKGYPIEDIICLTGLSRSHIQNLLV